MPLKAEIGHAGRTRIGRALILARSSGPYSWAAGRGLAHSVPAAEYNPAYHCCWGDAMRAIDTNGIPKNRCLVTIICPPLNASQRTGTLGPEEGVSLGSRAGRQLAQLATYLSHPPVLDRIYAGTLGTGYEAAAKLSELLGIPSGEIAGLNELDYGPWKGRILSRDKGRETSIEATDPESYRTFVYEPHRWRVEGTETIRQHRTRLNRALRKLVKAHAGKAIAIVLDPLSASLAFTQAFGIHDSHVHRVTSLAPASLGIIDFSVKNMANNNLLLWDDRLCSHHTERTGIDQGYKRAYMPGLAQITTPKPGDRSMIRVTPMYNLLGSVAQRFAAGVSRDECVVVFIRHPSTEFSPEGRLAGQTDIDLSPKGYQQIPSIVRRVERLLRYSGGLLSGVHSSDLRRTSLLADPLSTSLNRPLVIDSRLREENYGSWAGQILTRRFGGDESIEAQSPALYSAFLETPHLIRIPGTETTWEFRDRVHEAIREIATNNLGKVPVVVCHGRSMCMTHTIAFDLHPGLRRRIELPPAGGIGIIRFSSDLTDNRLLYWGGDQEASVAYGGSSPRL